MDDTHPCKGGVENLVTTNQVIETKQKIKHLGAPLCRPKRCQHCDARQATNVLSCWLSECSHHCYAAIAYMNDFIDSLDIWPLPKIHLALSHLASIIQMGNTLMELPWSHGGMVSFWFGTPPVQTPLLPWYMSGELPVRQEQWLVWQNCSFYRIAWGHDGVSRNSLYKGLGYFNRILVTSVAFFLCVWHVKFKKCLQFE